MTPERRTPVQFTRESAGRIARVIRDSELAPKVARPLTFESVAPQPSGNRVRIGTFSGAWDLGAFKVVTLLGTTATASVLNACNSVADAGCNRVVLFSSVNGTQCAVELQYRPTCATCHISIQGFDLSSLPGFASNQIQILGHDANACLTWYSTNTCA